MPKKGENRSLSVLMPGDQVPKFIAIACPCRPPLHTKGSNWSAQAASQISGLPLTQPHVWNYRQTRRLQVFVWFWLQSRVLWLLIQGYSCQHGISWAMIVYSWQVSILLARQAHMTTWVLVCFTSLFESKSNHATRSRLSIHVRSSFSIYVLDGFEAETSWFMTQFCLWRVVACSSPRIDPSLLALHNLFIKRDSSAVILITFR